MCTGARPQAIATSMHCPMEELYRCARENRADRQYASTAIRAPFPIAADGQAPHRHPLCGAARLRLHREPRKITRSGAFVA